MCNNMENSPVNEQNNPLEDVAVISGGFMMREFETSDIGMIVVDHNNRIKKFNSAWKRMLCIDEMSMIGKRFGDGFRCIESIMSDCGKGHKCVICSINCNIIQALESDKPITDIVFRHEFVLNDRNYSPILRAGFYPITCEGERCVLIMADDITDRKE